MDIKSEYHLDDDGQRYVVVKMLDVTSTAPLPVSSTTNSSNFDAYGRSRVSNPTTLFDSKLIANNAPSFWDDQETTGTGTSSTWSQDTAS